jgi:hypothetical protein
MIIYMTEIDLPSFSDYTLNLPAWFWVRTSDYGNSGRKIWFRLASPMSTARNLATRKKDLSVDLERSGVAEATLVENKGSDEKPIFERFSKSDQKRIRKYLKANGDDTFTNYPVLQRGRPEKLKKNILFNRSFSGYDDDFLKKVNETKRGKYISKEGVSSLPDVPDDENEDLLSEVTSLLSGDSKSAKSMIRGYPEIATPDTAYMLSRLPENMKKSKKAKSVRAPSVEEAMRIIMPKNPNDPWGELEGETFPEPITSMNDPRIIYGNAPKVSASDNAANFDITEYYRDGKIKSARNRVTGEVRTFKN